MVKRPPPLPELVPPEPILVLGGSCNKQGSMERGREVNTKLLVSDYGLEGSNILDEEGEENTIHKSLPHN